MQGLRRAGGVLPQIESGRCAEHDGAVHSREESRPLDPAAQRIVAVLSRDALSVDQVIAQTGMNAAQVTATLLALELDGRVRQLPGLHFVRR